MVRYVSFRVKEGNIKRAITRKKIYMYLKEILLENIASIKSLDLTLPFNPDSTPKPIVFVGINGSGKSIVLSYIVDAIFKLIEQLEPDKSILKDGIFTSHLKIHNKSSITIGESYSLGILEFRELNSSKRYNYLEKAGFLKVEDYKSKLGDRFTNMEGVYWNSNTIWLIEDYMKRLSPYPIDIKNLKEIFLSNIFCYFPSSRYEIPHWLNPEVLNKRIENNINYIDFSNNPINPIYVDSSLETNKAWILDVCLDSLLENEIGIDDLKQGKENLENIIQQILQNPKAKLKINNRNHDLSRLYISIDNKIVIPSLDNLSTGQTLLLNLFSTIIRYTDNLDFTKNTRLENITGIVLIDEIDAHLHSDLQYEVLPQLLKLFPKIQFIVTTHSPLFILGMEKEYDGEGFQIIELPEGNQITTERFSEFKKSFDYYKNTKAFTDELMREIKNKTKPLIYVEGETDKIYIETACKLLEKEDLLQKIEIEEIGFTNNTGHTKAGGHQNLNTVFKMIKSNPELSKRKILFLYDCDTNKVDEDFQGLRVRCIPRNLKNNVFNKGIENLISPDILKSEPSFDKERFYKSKVSKGDYGEDKVEEIFQKKDFCKWVCEDIKNKKYLEEFNLIIEIVEDFLKLHD